MNDFKELLTRVASTFKTQRELADKLDMDPSRLSKAMKGGDKFTFNVENCLRLADLSGEPAADVLRAAGKADVLELMQRLFGPERAVTDAILRDLVEQWATLSIDQKNIVRWTATSVLRERDTGTDMVAKNDDGSVTALEAKPVRTPRAKRVR